MGTVHVDLEDSGIIVNYDSCDAALTLVVDTLANPQITGSTVCQPNGILAGQSLTLTFNGNIAVDPAANGEVQLDWNVMFQPLDTWTGGFVGADTLEGAFSGAETMGSAGFAWDATFSVVR